MKLPSLQVYPGDWLKDPALRLCCMAAHGFCLHCIFILHECEPRGVFATNGVPWTDDQIASSIFGDRAENLALLHELLKNGVFSRDEAGAVYSRRMVREEEARRQQSEAGKRGAQFGALGGRPKSREITPHPLLTPFPKKRGGGFSKPPKNNPPSSSYSSSTSKDNTPHSPPEGGSCENPQNEVEPQNSPEATTQDGPQFEGLAAPVDFQGAEATKTPKRGNRTLEEWNQAILKNALPQIPGGLREGGFFRAWCDWERYRVEKGEPIGPTARARQMTALSQMAEGSDKGVQEAIESIDRSISAGWSGLFPPKKQGPAQAYSRRETADEMAERRTREIFGEEQQ